MVPAAAVAAARRGSASARIGHDLRVLASQRVPPLAAALAEDVVALAARRGRGAAQPAEPIGRRARRAGSAGGSARWRRCGGASSTCTTRRGCFGPTSAPATCARSSSTVGSVAPGATTIAADTTSPHAGSGMPTTATSATAGCDADRGLDLDRRDPLASGADRLRRASGDGEVAVGVAGDEVAGVEPAVGVDGLGGGVGTVEVAREHGRPAQPELAVVGDVRA